MEWLELLDETVRFWQPRVERPLTQEDARQMVENITGFFSVLQSWSATDTVSYQTKADEEAA